MDRFETWYAQHGCTQGDDCKEFARKVWNGAIGAASGVVLDEAKNPYSHGAGDAYGEVVNLISLDPPPSQVPSDE